MSNLPINKPEPSDYGSLLFKSGKFMEAQKVLLQCVKEDPYNYQALILLGRIYLYSNKFLEAEEYLITANEIRRDEIEPKQLLAELYYRQDRFLDAAPFYQKIGKEEEFERLWSFKDCKPYEIESKKESTKIKLITVDPLPIIQAKINNKKTINLLIDTGAAEVIIDREYAKEIGLDVSSSGMGIFAGGKKAKFESSKIDSLSFKGLKISNVPVTILPTRPFSQIFNGIRIDGIIGTVLFYHFITTMDYVNGKLILRKKTQENLEAFETELLKQKPIEIPFWLAGDHYMIAWGSVNQSEPILLFVDTGLAGGGFTGAQSTIEKAGIKLDEEKSKTVIGGGGELKIVPFIVDELALGNACEKEIKGTLSEQFVLEDMFGFKIGGIISHEFFKNYSLTFDFDNMRLILVRSE